MLNLINRPTKCSVGKTLNTLKINGKPDSVGRPVYYFNIKQLTLVIVGKVIVRSGRLNKLLDGYV